MFIYTIMEINTQAWFHKIFSYELYNIYRWYVEVSRKETHVNPSPLMTSQGILRILLFF